MTKQIKQPNPSKAFNAGLSEVKVKDLPEVRESLKRILKVKTDQSLRNYANGLVENLDVDKASQIENLFKSYGISNPWGV